MNNQFNNPFLISGYLSQEYFCDREIETKELISAFNNGRNIVLISPRRMGKTGLIEHCFNKMDVKQNFNTLFIDIYSTSSLKEFVYIFGKSVFNSLKPRGKKFIDNFFSIITSLRPAFKLDAISGQPVFDISLGEINQPLLSLEEIFSYLEQADKPCIVAIDEFQQIAKYPEKNIEALLRTYIQKCVNTRFVFSGSQRHMMENIFFSPSKPFYQSASVLNLEAIPLNDYSRFVAKFFKQSGKNYSEGIIQKIYNLFDGHTWYMQSVFNRLYEYIGCDDEMSITMVDSILHKTVDANKLLYQGIVSMLAEKQKEVLIAIAKAKKAKEVTSAEFIKHNSLSSPSSVQSAIRLLLDKELISKEDNTYFVYDKFFGLWLEENYGVGYRL